MLEDRELVNYVEWEIDNALGEDEIRQEREKALQYYYGEKQGNLSHPGEGRSSVVMLTVREAIETAMPMLMDIFASTPEAVRFDPTGPGDEDAAQQQTDFLNHVFYKHNPGFVILYTWLKDGLLSKNGYVKAWVDDQQATERETLHGQTDAQLVQLEADPDVEIEEVESEDVEVFGVPFTLHKVVFDRVKPKRIRIANVPPEYVKVSNDCTKVCLQDARFVGIQCKKTLSDLIEMFPDKKEEIMNLGVGEDDDIGERIYRYNKSDEERQDDIPDPAMRMVTYTEAFYKVDYDEDGIAERRLVQTADKLVLDNNPVSHVQLYGWTPTIEPHKHVGISEADLTMDLQEIYTTLTRQMLDNLYLTNNPEKEVVEPWLAPDGLDDLASQQAGGIKRVDRPNAIREMTVPFSAQHSVPIMEWLDRVKSRRTGIRDEMMTLDPNVLRQANTGVVNTAMDAAMSRLKLVARLFAETGLSSLMRGMQKLVLEGDFQQEVVKLRGRWVPINPLEWRERTAMTVAVGLGTGQRAQIAEALSNILQVQMTMQEKGMYTASPENIYNTAKDLVREMGISKDPERYYTDPTTPEIRQAMMQEAQQPSTTQLAFQIEQAKLQVQAQRDQGEAQIKAMEIQLEQQRNSIQQQKVADEAVDRRTKMELEYDKNVPGAGV